MEGLAADDASPASAVRERYERMFKEKQRGPKPGAPASGDPAAAALAAQAVKTAFRGSISSVFNSHLGCVMPLLTVIHGGCCCMLGAPLRRAGSWPSQSCHGIARSSSVSQLRHFAIVLPDDAIRI